VKVQFAASRVAVHSDFRFGVNVQPEFGVTQHENGKHILAEFKDLFDGKGKLHLKPGSQDMWEYNLLGLTNLIDHVVPFYLKYVVPFSGKVKEFNTFLEILERKQRKEHFTQEGLIDMVKLAYTLNVEGKDKIRKRTLEEVLAIIPTTRNLRDHTPSRQRHPYFSFDLTLLFDSYN
jgi:hypothetical protein